MSCSYVHATPVNAYVYVSIESIYPAQGACVSVIRMGGFFAALVATNVSALALNMPP